MCRMQLRLISCPRLGCVVQVLVRIAYAGINGGCETFRTRGEYAFSGNSRLSGSFPLGAEGAGVVAALGPGSAKGGLQVCA